MSWQPFFPVQNNSHHSLRQLLLIVCHNHSQQHVRLHCRCTHVCRRLTFSRNSHRLLNISLFHSGPVSDSSPAASHHSTSSLHRQPPLVGIVGGVGSGKSSVPRAVSDLRLLIIDADQIGHRQLQIDQIRQQLVQQFGNQILQDDGQISRSALADCVFGDTTAHAVALEQLNRIVRPGIRSEIQRQRAQAPHDVDAIILDAALLLEAGWAADCDLVVFIDTPDELRIHRVAETRHWSADELQRREAAQLPLHRKQEACDITIQNSGSLEASANELSRSIRTLLAANQHEQQPDRDSHPS